MSRNNSPAQPADFSASFSCKGDQEFFAQAPMGIFTSMPEGRFLAVNPAMAGMFGYDSAPEMIESITDIGEQLYADPSDREELIHLMQERGAAIDHECRFLRRDGTVFWVSGNFRAVQDREGRIAALQGFLTDITERKSVQKSLEDKSDLLELITKNMFDMVSLTDMQGNFEFVGKSHQILGYDPDFLIGKNVLDFVHPDDLPRIIEELKSFVHRMDDGRKAEYRYRRKDGSYVWLETIGKLISESDFGSPGKILFNTRDISDRKQADDALRESEVRFRSIYENTSVGFAHVSLDFKIMSANRAYCNMLGYREEELVGKHLREITHADSLEENIHKQEELAAGRIDHYRIEKKFIHKKGQTIHAILDANLIRDAAGKGIYFIGSAVDITAIEQTQKELLKSRKLLRDMEKVSKVGGWEYEVQTGRLTWTEGTYRIHAVSPRDFDPNNVPRNIQFYAPEDQAAINKALKEAVELGISYDLELGFTNAAGEQLCVRTIGEPEQENGRVVRVYGNIMDVTERKDMERSLAHSHYLMRYVIEHANSAVAVHDKEFRYMYVSQSYLDQFRVKEKEVLGRHHYEVFPHLPRKWKDVHQRALRGEVTRAERDPFYRRDGSLEWTSWECRPWYEMDNSIGGFIVYTEIVTDQVREEEALRESEKRFRALLEDVEMVAVQSYDENRRVIFWNKASEILYGYSRKEALGAKLEDLIIPECMRAEVVRNIYNWREKGGNIPAGELELRHKDGSPVPVYTSHVMQEKSNGEKELFCIDVDLTEVKKANDQLVRAKEKAEAANKAKSEFLANMSHEIRTPLNGIMGMHQLLRTTVLDAEQSEYLGMAQNASRRLTRLLSDILDLSRIESGKMEIKEEEIIPEEIRQSVEDVFRHTCRENNNNLRVTLDTDIPAKLLGDYTRLTQILFNLAGNALKYTRHGEIGLQVSCLPGRKPGKCRLLFVVEDNGIGIPEDKIDQVFETFTQAGDADSPYARQFEGAGLGLPLVKRLVHLMGGNLSLASQPGTGTVVYVSLPFKLPDDRRQELGSKEREGTSFRIQGQRMLVVDDEPVTRLYIRRLLEKQGVEVSVVGNGEQAVDMLGKEDFDCVLMDVQMPVMDGVEATKKIRSSNLGFKNIPIIALTAYAMSGDRKKFLEAGMDDYLAKPVEKDKLFAVLEKHLRG
ncbi:MAG: PAS domain S-box protein [Desulfovibrionales bacterium]